MNLPLSFSLLHLSALFLPPLYLTLGTPFLSVSISQYNLLSPSVSTIHISSLSIFSLRYPSDFLSFPLSSPLLYLALSIPIYRQSFSRLSLSSFSLSLSFSIVLHFSLPISFPVSIFRSLALALTIYPFPL